MYFVKNSRDYLNRLGSGVTDLQSWLNWMYYEENKELVAVDGIFYIFKSSDKDFSELNQKRDQRRNNG